MKSLVGSEARARHLADILKALGHASRLRIVAVLCEREETVGEIAGRLDLPQAIVSQQLRILRMSGLVEASREKGFARYRLAQPRLRELLRCLDGCPVRGTAAEAAQGGRRER
jgi:DNA-binding transcriptional ArsR family regulator